MSNKPYRTVRSNEPFMARLQAPGHPLDGAPVLVAYRMAGELRFLVPTHDPAARLDFILTCGEGRILRVFRAAYEHGCQLIEKFPHDHAWHGTDDVEYLTVNQAMRLLAVAWTIDPQSWARASDHRDG